MSDSSICVKSCPYDQAGDIEQKERSFQVYSLVVIFIYFTFYALPNSLFIKPLVQYLLWNIHLDHLYDIDDLYFFYN